MSAGAPPSSSPSDPLSSLVIVPTDPVAMPPPPSSPPPPAPPVAAVEDEDEDEDEEERPWPPPTMRMKLYPYAVFRVCGGMGRAGDHLLVASVAIHYLNIVASLLSFYAGGEQARFFWALVGRVTQFLCYAFYTFITCVFIRYYMRVDGDYHETFDPPQRQQLAPAAAEAEQLPPPPPEMDMC